MGRADGQPPCTLSSLTAGESVTATAVESTDSWVLLEVPGGWAPKANDTASLPDAVRAAWSRVSAMDRARMQFIKRGPLKSSERRIYVGSSGDKPWWYTWTLPSLEALSNADVNAWLSGHVPHTAETVNQPLYLVCTHGKRDACCAKYGVAMYRTLSALAPDRVWQASHIGGHRFAATLLAFPTGHCFGRLSPDHAQQLFEAYEDRRLEPLESLRGRTSMTRAEQAGAYHLRAAHDWVDLDDIRNAQTLNAQTAEGERRLMFDTPKGCIEVQARAKTGNAIYGSCFKTKIQLSVDWECKLTEP